MDEFEEALFKAYFRLEGKLAPQPERGVTYVTIDDQEYAVLTNINGILAVFKLYPEGKIRFRRVRDPELIDKIAEELGYL